MSGPILFDYVIWMLIELMKGKCAGQIGIEQEASGSYPLSLVRALSTEITKSLLQNAFVNNYQKLLGR